MQSRGWPIEALLAGKHALARNYYLQSLVPEISGSRELAEKMQLEFCRLRHPKSFPISFETITHFGLEIKPSIGARFLSKSSLGVTSFT